MTQYTFSYEVSKDTQVRSGQEVVEAESEERAREFAEHVLEEKFPGDEGYVLLSLELI